MSYGMGMVDIEFTGGGPMDGNCHAAQIEAKVPSRLTFPHAEDKAMVHVYLYDSGRYRYLGMHDRSKL